MLKNDMLPEQIAKYTDNSLKEIASPVSPQTSFMEAEMGRKLEENMMAHDALYRELAGEGPPDGQRRPVHP